MKKLLLCGVSLALTASTAYAGGIERTTQSALVMYKPGNYAELSYGSITPSVSGEGSGVALAGLASGTKYDSVAKDYNQIAGSVKLDLNDRLSFGLIIDSPAGADIKYGGAAATTELGGTSAYAEVNAQTFLLKYQINKNASIFGGVRRQTSHGEIGLSGIAYGSLQVSPLGAVVRPGASGYGIELDASTDTGYVLGAAYEIPDIALRVALTYNSEIEHEMSTKETLPASVVVGGAVVATTTLTEQSTTKVSTPRSWNLEFQSGVAKDTLVFGSVRWVKHSEFRILPSLLGSDLVELEDKTTYRLGVGRRFNDNFAGQVSVAYEPEGDELVSPLAPTNGYSSISVGGAYTFDNGFALAGGASWIKVGGAKAQTSDTARASFDGNTVFGAGVKISYTF